MVSFVDVPGKPVVGHLLDIHEGPELLMRSVRSHGDYLRFRFGPYSWLLVNDPEAVRHVLVKNHDNYVKSRNYVALKLAIGKGLVTSEGELWKRQRRLMQPIFTPRNLDGFVAPMVRCTRDMLERWSSIEEGTVIDLHQEMMRLTFRIVGMTLMSKDLERDADEFGEAVSHVLEFANRYTESAVRLPIELPLPSHRRFRRELGKLDAVVHGLIRERRRDGETGNDLLGMLLGASETMSDQQLRDEVMTMILAGHETTAVALSWTWFFLSQHPAVARQVFAEARDVLGDREPTVEDLDQLVYTERVLQESMRLHPPVWAIERDALGPDVIEGHAIEKGTTVGVSAWTLHRHPDHWENPEGFDPDRWTEERVAARPRWVYLPFGAGPRVCIGSRFAMIETKLALAMMAREYDLQLLPGKKITMDPGITLRPRHGIPMRLLRRRPPPRRRAAAA